MPSHLEPIKSADALRSAGDDLVKVAQTYFDRAEALEKLRANHLAYWDKFPVLEASKRAFNMAKHGAPTASACRKYSDEFKCDFEAVKMVTERKLNAWRQDERRKRNEAIRKRAARGAKLRRLSDDYKLSKGQISKICNS